MNGLSWEQRGQAYLVAALGNVVMMGFAIMAQPSATFVWLAAPAMCCALGVIGWLAAPPECVERLVAWAIACVSGFLLLMRLMTVQAHAETVPTYRSPYNPPAAREDWHEHARYRRQRKVWREEVLSHGAECQPTLSVVGDQYATPDGARKEADKAWMQTARWQYGERYMDRKNADDATYECGRSSVGSLAGEVFIRCRLVAKPCRPPKQDAQR